MSGRAWTREEIKALRMKYRLNQSALARIVGMRGQQAVSDWECGVHKPSRVARILLDRAEETLFRLFDRDAAGDHQRLSRILLRQYGVETKTAPAWGTK